MPYTELEPRVRNRIFKGVSLDRRGKKAERHCDRPTCSRITSFYVSALRLSETTDSVVINSVTISADLVTEGHQARVESKVVASVDLKAAS